MSSVGGSIHQIVNLDILKHLLGTCDKNYLILHDPVDVILSKHEVRQPDLVLIRRDRMDIVSRRGVEGSPDLVAESIHPFQDGNGRVGRIIMFKECLKNDILPFIIDHEQKLVYYRGLKEYKTETGYLMDPFKAAQDQYEAIVSYFFPDVDNIPKA